MKDAGLDCELQRDRESLRLTPGVDLVSYRLVEAVLGCARRRGAQHAVVAIRDRADAVELEVRGDASISRLDEGLREITDRIELYEGSLRLHRSGEGFTALARLPRAAEATS